MGVRVLGADMLGTNNCSKIARSAGVCLHPGGSTAGEVKIEPLNLFMNISRGSDILGKGVEPRDSPGKHSPARRLST